MKQLKLWHIIGALFTIVAGTLLHFTYEWSGSMEFVSFFTPVNESTWEHLKLIFFPIIVFAFIEEFFYGMNQPNFIPVKIFSAILGMVLIVVIFYTYTGILGDNYFILDLLTFILAVIGAYAFSYHFLKTDTFSSRFSRYLSYLLLFCFLLFFIIFTESPPDIALFRDPTLPT